jgi:hypothetical protein
LECSQLDIEWYQMTCVWPVVHTIIRVDFTWLEETFLWFFVIRVLNNREVDVSLWGCLMVTLSQAILNKWGRWPTASFLRLGALKSHKRKTEDELQEKKNFSFLKCRSMLEKIWHSSHSFSQLKSQQENYVSTLPWLLQRNCEVISFVP